MSIKHKVEDGGVLVLELDVENLDAGNVRAIKEQLGRLMDEHRHVVLDMSHLKFVDSSGLGALISCLRQTRTKGGDFRLACMTSTVRALFELMRMHRVFSIYDSRPEAIASFE
jgi:anti-sigma B factor antagonist